jgi:hypothetical protein
MSASGSVESVRLLGLLRNEDLTDALREHFELQRVAEYLFFWKEVERYKGEWEQFSSTKQKHQGFVRKCLKNLEKKFQTDSYQGAKTLESKLEPINQRNRSMSEENVLQTSQTEIEKFKKRVKGKFQRTTHCQISTIFIWMEKAPIKSTFHQQFPTL